MKAERVTVYRCKCEVCGHEWKADAPPLRCAGCKSPYWSRVPVKAAKENAKKGGRKPKPGTRGRGRGKG